MAGDGRMMCGGKAANQAMAIAKLGGTVDFVSAVGSDAMADVVFATMRKFGIRVEHMQRSSAPTLTGVVIVSADGSNRIVVDPAATGKVSPADIEKQSEVIGANSVCLVSGDGFPDAAALAALTIARRAGVVTIFNPAPPPSPELRAAILRESSYVTPNEAEARVLSDVDSDDPEVLVRAIIGRGAQAVVMTLGERGAFVSDPAAGIETLVPAPHVEKVVDTSGAGDAFNGALAIALASGHGIVNAVRFACAAAAIITQGPGLEDALPLWEGLSVPPVGAAQ